MFGQFFFFIFGCLIMGAIMFPILRSYKKHIRELEEKNNNATKSIAEFRDRTAKLAIGICENAGSVSLSGQNNHTSGISQAGNMEKNRKHH